MDYGCIWQKKYGGVPASTVLCGLQTLSCEGLQPIVSLIDSRLFNGGAYGGVPASTVLCGLQTLSCEVLQPIISLIDCMNLHGENILSSRVP